MQANPMTGRQRLQAVLKKQPKDRISWTTLVDDATLALLPDDLRGNGGIDFYKHLGCDIFLLNGWNTPHHLQSPAHSWPENVKVSVRHEPEQYSIEWATSKGTLKGVWRGAHPLKYPVDSREALLLYREMWEGVSFTQADDSRAFAALEGLIGDDGVVTRFWGPSTIPRLLEQDMGTENFYYMMADHPHEMDALISTMHQREMDAFKILAAGPWDSVTLVENTSTFYISPDIYQRYNMPHQRDFVDAVHAAGKTAIIHMCGHVRGLLPLIRETGLDGIHALTPPPTGDTPWEAALDELGEDLIIFGCLDPTIFASGKIAEIPAALNALITKRLRNANFVLAPMADGIAVDPARFQAIAAWIQKHA